MVILGVTHPISWNNAACILIDGQLVAFAEEERFTRVKHAPHTFPRRAVDYCLQVAGVSREQVQATGIGFVPPATVPMATATFDRYNRGELAGEDWNRQYMALTLYLRDMDIEVCGRRLHFDHHLCHVASTVVPSGHEATNFISLDGWGGEASGLLGWMSADRKLHGIRPILPAQSWGRLYQHVTGHLGFRPHSGEGKTMGLAAYGTPDESVLPDWCDPELGLPDVQRYMAFLDARPRLPPRIPPSAESIALAATLQHYYERSLLRMAERLFRESGLPDFALAGGVALNCTGNGRLAAQDYVRRVFVQPASHDAGTALGAAILAHQTLTGEIPRLRFPHAYWGPEYTDREIRECLEFAGAPFLEVDPADEAARALRDDLVIGFFQGRSEVGPRALGNRSILANPSVRANLERVNLRIKRREVWRPLAPSVLAERFHDLFEARVESPFMLMAFPTRAGWRSRIPAVVHTDGSARPQSVSRETNPLFHRTISRFEELSGIPAVLNTSFNLDDEPVVNSPEQALATFYRSGLDGLIIGGYAVYKRTRPR